MSISSLLNVSEMVGVGPEQVTAQTVYFCIKFPSEYRYYFVFTQNDEIPILIEHPFRVYYPQTIVVSWDTLTGGEGINLDLNSIPGYSPFGDTVAQINIPQQIYNEIVVAFSGSRGSVEQKGGIITTTTEVNFVASGMLGLFQFFMDTTLEDTADLQPPVLSETSGIVEFILISTLEGPQYKIDLSHLFPVPPESPITIDTLEWNEVLFQTVIIHDYAFYYLPTEGNLAMTFVDPKFCFLRQWVIWPPAWVEAIKEFSETS